MRVLHVAAGLARAPDGSAGDEALQTAIALARLEVETAILTGADDASQGEGGATAEIGGIPILRVGPVTEGARDWWNDAVTPTFCAFTQRFRPDIVHVHSIAGLGVQVLDAARSCGAQIVVSMRDLWWICERRDAVDSTGWSCIPAVTPGSCACRTGSAGLAERNAALRRALRPQDLVLVRSEAVAARLQASGIRARIAVVPLRPQDPEGWPDVAGRVKVEYQDLLARALARPAPAAEKAPARVLLIAGAAGPPLHYRVHQKVEQLRLAGVASEVYGYTDPRLPAAADRSDAVIIYRAPATRELVQLIDTAQQRGLPTFYDVDDLVFDPDAVAEMPIHGNRPDVEMEIWVETARRYCAALLACGRGIASTPELARQMRRMGVPAHVHPNGVDTQLAVLSEGARRERRDPPDQLTIAYCSGTDTHDADLAMIGEVLGEFLDRHLNARLVLAGPLRIPTSLRRRGSRVELRGVVGRQQYVRWFAGFDLNLAPLVPHTFNECKSSIKWSEAALIDVATLASATQPFREAVDHRVTGLLANGPDEFAENLRWAAEDIARVRAVGRAARLAAYQAGSPWKLGPDLVGILGAPNAGEMTPGLASSPIIWPSASALTALEPEGLVGGEFPTKVPMRPGPRLAAGPVQFELPNAAGAGPLRQVDIHVATWSRPAEGGLTLAIHTETGVVAEATAPAETIADNGWATFAFAPGVTTPAGAVAEIRTCGGDNVSPYVMPYGRRKVAGHRRLGMVAAKLYYALPEPPAFADPVVPLTLGRPFQRRAARTIYRATRALALGRRVLRHPSTLPEQVRRVVGSRR